jgi:hypothetical protein
MTKRELIDRGLWDFACLLLGIDVWESAENIEPIEFTSDQLVCLGLQEYQSLSKWDVRPCYGESPLLNDFLAWSALCQKQAMAAMSIYCLPSELVS